VERSADALVDGVDDVRAARLAERDRAVRRLERVEEHAVLADAEAARLGARVREAVVVREEARIVRRAHDDGRGALVGQIDDLRRRAAERGEASVRGAARPVARAEVETAELPERLRR